MQRLASDKKCSFIPTEVLALILICLICLLFVPSTHAYYGLSGLGLYGGLGYGGSGLYGLGGMYGGLYGMMGLYGLGGLYGFSGGLYGLSGLGRLYTLGGLYGLGGLSGLGGLCGLGGLYGLGGLCGLGGLYGLGGMGCGLGGGLLGSMGLLSLSGLLNPTTKSTAQPAPVMTAEQAGTWTGTWTSLVTLKGGIMNMSLVEDVVTGTLSGQVNLLLNKVTNSIPADVSGYLTPINPGSLGITGAGGAIATFVLVGGNQNFFSTSFLILPSITSALSIYSIKLTCIMTSPVTMIGTYDVEDIYKLEVDSGEFELILSAPVI